MKNFKMKLQEFKKNYRYFWERMKRIMKVKFVRFERKLGLAVRCSMCEDNLFCEDFNSAPPSKSIFHVRRCTDSHSTR